MPGDAAGLKSPLAMEELDVFRQITWVDIGRRTDSTFLEEKDHPSQIRGVGGKRGCSQTGFHLDVG